VSPVARPPDDTAPTVAQPGGAAPAWQGRFAAGTILAGRYVDGEDLRSLPQRVGRLPTEGGDEPA
jgi:hypothetical protein